MNLKIGMWTFTKVQIPLLWGSRVVLDDREGRISVVDLSGDTATVEIIGDRPAFGVDISMDLDSLTILCEGSGLYRYTIEQKLLSSLDLGLPDCQIGRNWIRVACNAFLGTTMSRLGTITAITKDGIVEGASLPPELSEFII